MKISRRDFLKGTATTLFLAGFNLPALATSSRKKNLVVIMLRGGMDGLCAVPVIGDKNFEKRRKSILIEDTIKLNSDFDSDEIVQNEDTLTLLKKYVDESEIKLNKNKIKDLIQSIYQESFQLQ